MSTIKGSQTELNLLKAFAGESQARMRYTFFAKIAKKEGLEYFSGIFAETAENEQQHAKSFFKFLEGGDTEITATYPAGKLGSTLENLQEAADGELEEWSDLYPKFAQIAKEENFPEVATTFQNIVKVEKAHEERYRKLYNELKAGKVFESDTPVIWKCRKCGYIFEGTKAPEKCPACGHPQGYFEKDFSRS